MFLGGGGVGVSDVGGGGSAGGKVQEYKKCSNPVSTIVSLYKKECLLNNGQVELFWTETISKNISLTP